MNLNRALSDIAQIRAQLERTESYRGFRSLTVGISSLYVLFGGCLQLFWIEYPAQQPLMFLRLWVSIALLAAFTCTVEMLIRNRTSDSSLTTRMHRSLIGKTMPAILVGAVVTVAIGIVAREDGTLIRLLPGIWAMVYGLGLWSCGSSLPRMAHLATLYFLASGAFALLQSVNALNVHPAQMVLLFGVGQLILSVILYWKVERFSGKCV